MKRDIKFIEDDAMNDKQLFRIISDTVSRIENEMHALNSTGVFFAPDLYVGFEIGKEVYKFRNQIFGIDVNWIREQYFKDIGLIDLFFGNDVNSTAIELKLRSTVYDYFTDLGKLGNLPSNINKYFLVLANSFDINKDDRLDKIENTLPSQIQRIDKKKFPTWDIYEKQIYCHLALYKML